MMIITDVLTRIRRKTRRCRKAKAGALLNVPVGYGILIREAVREATQYLLLFVYL